MNWLYRPTIAQPTTPDESTNVSAAEHRRPSARPGWLKFGVPSRLFSASVFAAHIPVVLADAGDDLSNNFISDLSPVLALFGERVAMQYMSHSMSRIEDFIFAMAPLGIITAITGAIRVGGPSYLKAIIGRAREGKGVTEVELMSSTSTDVCELWDGNGVSRVSGSADPAPIIELFYYERTRSGEPAALNPDQSSLMEPWDKHATQVYDFAAGIDAGILQLQSSTGATGESEKTPPNLGLNIGRPRVSRLELILVAIVGIFLQVGVLVFAGVSALSSLNKKLTKNNQRVQLYAFPTMAAGTVALVTGMFFCAYIIEQSTDEASWTVTNPGPETDKQAKIAWIQRKAVVNDQQFDSYFIQRRGPKVSHTFAKKWLNANSELHITKSRKSRCRQVPLTVFAVFVSTIGFLAQFIGLRGLNWSVTVAQLVATAIMVILRAVVRRGLVLDEVLREEIYSGYELEWTAKKIKDCGHWAAVTWGLEHDMNVNTNGLAMEVVETRCRLGELFQWESQWKDTVDSTVRAIEAAMNLFTGADFTLTDMAGARGFEWQLIVEVHERRVADGALVGVGPNVAPADAEPATLFEAIRLEISREWLPEGRGWSGWRVDKANRSKIESILGLWMLHFKELEERIPRGTRSLRMLDIEKATFDRWIRREAKTIKADPSGRTGDEIVGKPSNIQLPSDLLTVISEIPLEAVCGQLLFSSFIAGIAEILEPIGGIVRVRGGQQAVKASFGWRNTVLDKLAEEVEQTKLATIEEALLSIVSPLSRAGKLPTSLDMVRVFGDTAEEISACVKCGRFDLAEPLLLWLLDTAESSATTFETEGKWKDACRVLMLLRKACDKIDGGEEYATQAEEAMGFFCERHFVFHKKVNTHGTEDTLNFLHATLDDEGDVWARKSADWGARLANREDDTECLTEADLGFRDSSERTRLILASIKGHTTIVSQLLERKAEVHAKDSFGRNAIHYAAAGNSTSIIHILLRNATSGECINAVDGEGRSALGLASEKGRRIAVALLIFYGADVKTRDRDGWTPLHRTAENGHEEMAQLLLNRGAEVNAKDDDGWTALLRGSSNGHEATVRLLLDCGAHIEAASSGGWTALLRAASNGHKATVRLLLDRGARIEAASSDGRTALLQAASNGHEATVRLLLDHSARIEATPSGGRTALHQAASNGHEATVRLLLDRGAHIEAASSDGWTTLIQAASNGHETTVQTLLDRGARIETASSDGLTALLQAASNGHEATVRLLLDRNAPIEAASSGGWTALLRAASNGHEATVRLLLDRGAPSKAASSDGWTALYQAASNGHEATVRLLLDRGACIEAASSDEWAALLRAASNGHENVVRLLLDCGARIEAASSDGWTVLVWASSNGHESTVRLLLDRGACIETASSNGWTALLQAASNGHEATVRLLLDRGARIEAALSDGWTALHQAASNGHEATVRLLLDRGARIEAAPSSGWTALLRAASNGHDATVRLLLDRGARIEAALSDGCTALLRAASNGHEATVRLLLDRSARIEAAPSDGCTALLRAASNGHKATVRLLLDRGARIEAAPSDGCTALLRAASNGHEATVRLLLDRGARIEAASSDGWTALIRAASNGYEAIARLLLDRGAPIEAAFSDELAALIRAFSNGHVAAARLLLQQIMPSEYFTAVWLLLCVGWLGHAAIAWLRPNHVVYVSFDHVVMALRVIWDDPGQATLQQLAWGYFGAMALRLPVAPTALWGISRTYLWLILDLSERIRTAPSRRTTALIQAASNGHEATVKLLLDRKIAHSLRDLFVR